MDLSGVADHSSEPVDYERYGFGPDGSPIRDRSETIRLATLDMPGGTRIEFSGDLFSNHIGMVEVGGDSHVGVTFGLESKVSLLDMYTRLVPKDVPVPEMLLKHTARTETEYEELRKRYPHQECVEEPIQVPDDYDELDFSAGTPVPRANPTLHSGFWDCNKGADDFQKFACQGGSPSGFIPFCDEHRQYNFLDRWTGKAANKRRYSFSITAVCNTPIGYLRHYYKFAGNWWLLFDITLPPDYWVAAHWKGAWGPAGKLNRWVRHGVLDTPAGGAYFRAFTAMHNG